MNADELAIQATLDKYLIQFQTTGIQYLPYVATAVDPYGQQVKTFGTPVTVIGRAILRPTPEKVTVIGNDEQYDVAFLFCRAELLRKFSAAEEGKWMESSGRMTWWDRTFKIEHCRPTGQVGLYFLLFVALANSLQGERDS